MTERSNLMLLVARANPVDDPNDIADSLDLHETLLAVIDERSDDVTSTERIDQLGRLTRTIKPAVAFAVALVVLLVVLAGTTLIFSGSTPLDEPADTVPTTVLPESTSLMTTVAEVEATSDTDAAGEPATILTWETVDLPVTEAFPHPGSIAHTDGRFVAGGVGLWHSNDLVTWTRVADADVSVEESVEIEVGLRELNHLTAGPLGFIGTYSGGMYVWDYGARGVAAVYVSEDGLKWTQSEIREPDAWDTLNINDLAAGGPGWIAVGDIGGRDGRIWVSEDGLTWETIVLQDFEGVVLTEIWERNGQLSVFGTRGDPLYEDAVPRAWTSEDGLNWQPESLEDQPVNRATHSISINPETGQHVALNLEGVWTSDDGVSWREVNSDNGTPPYTHPTQGAVWLGNAIIGVHRYTDWIFESTDGGVTWVRSHPFSHEDEGTWPHRLYVYDDTVIATVGGLWIGTAN